MAAFWNSALNYRSSVIQFRIIMYPTRKYVGIVPSQQPYYSGVLSARMMGFRNEMKYTISIAYIYSIFML